MKTVESTHCIFPGAHVELTGDYQSMPIEPPEGLPGLSYARDSVTKPDGVIDFHDDEMVNLQYDDRDFSVQLRGPSTELGNGINSLYLAQGLAEGIRQPKGIFLIHAAATMSPDDKAILLVGNQGYGKTAVTLSLCMEHGHKLIGNDLVLLRGSIDVGSGYNMQIIDGTKYIYLRETALRANSFLGELALGLVPDQSLASFMDKHRVETSQLNIEEAAEVPARIDSVWQVWLDGTNTERVTKHDYSELLKSLFFSERLGRHISGIISPIVRNDGTLLLFSPNFDTAEAQAERLKAASFLSKLCKLVSGPDGSQVASAIVGESPKI